AGIAPGWSRTIQIDYLRRIGRQLATLARVGGTLCAADDQYFAVIVHHSRTPIACAVQIVRYETPRAGFGNIQVAANLARSGTEDFPVGCNKHKRVEWQRQVCCRDVPPATRRILPYLRNGVIAISRINPSTGHENVTIWQCSNAWIPPAIIHIGKFPPFILERVIRVATLQPYKILDVTAAYKQTSIR